MEERPVIQLPHGERLQFEVMPTMCECGYTWLSLAQEDTALFQCPSCGRMTGRKLRSAN